MEDEFRRKYPGHSFLMNSVTVGKQPISSTLGQPPHRPGQQQKTVQGLNDLRKMKQAVLLDYKFDAEKQPSTAAESKNDFFGPNAVAW